MATSPVSSPATNDLLLPGPQPPLSHFGVTLLRHVVVTGLRYTLYHLGLPPPDHPPVRIAELRLYLDRSAVERLLAPVAQGPAVAAALTDPGGVALPEEVAPTGAVFFHRLRLRLAPRRRAPATQASPTGSVAGLEHLFRRQLSERLPALNDALLGEVLAVLARRRRRQRGAVAPAVGPAAAAWAAGGKPRLARLGPPDPLVPSWLENAPAVELADDTTRAHRDGWRGGFRETYREVLEDLRPALGAIGETARANGVVDHPRDLFFLPFELLDDLAGSAKPPWLSAAVVRNRAEYHALVEAADDETATSWNLSPIHPLP